MNYPTHPSKYQWLYFLGPLIIFIALILLFLPALRGCVGRITEVGGQDPSVVAYMRVMDESRKALAKDPNNDTARLAMAEATFYLGGVREALKEIKKIEETGASPQGLDKLKQDIADYRKTWEEAGGLYAESNNSADPASFYPGIHAICDEVLNRYDAILLQRAHFLKAHILLREGRKDEARREIEPLLGKYILLKDYCQYYYARTLITEENQKKAMKEFDELLAFYPKSRIAPLGLLEQLNILRDEGKPDEAKAKAKRLLDKYPKTEFAPTARRKLAEMDEAKGDTRAALREYFMIIDGWPEGEEARKAIIYIQQTDPALAEFTAEEKLRLLEVIVDRGYYDYAEPLLMALGAANPGDKNLTAGAFYHLARVYFQQGKYDSCIAGCKQVLGIGPSGPWAGKAYNRMAHAYRRKGDLAKAAESYDAAARSDKSLAPYALYNAGNILYSQNELAASSERFSQIDKNFRDSSEDQAALKQLVVIAYRNGDYASAVEYSDKLIDRYPDGELAAAAHFWRAKALLKLGKDIDASEELTFLTGHFQRTYYGIRALEILGADMNNISRLVFWTAADQGKGVKGGPGPDRLEVARELLRTNIFDLALDEFATIRKGITPESNFAQVQNAYLAGDWYTAYKWTREFFSHGYCNLLNGIELADMLKMGFPLGYKDEIAAVAARYKLNPSMLDGLILQESSFRADAVSPSNAIGLMQILPSTGTFIAHLKGLKTFDSSILYDPKSNLDYGAFYFKYLLGEFDNNLMMVLAAYNGGPGNAKGWRGKYYNGDMDLFIETIPYDETRDFIRYVYTNIRIYQAIALHGSE